MRELYFKLKNKINFKKTLFLIISKSGNTIETLWRFFIEYFENQLNNIIVISEKKIIYYIL